MGDFAALDSWTLQAGPPSTLWEAGNLKCHFLRGALGLLVADAPLRDAALEDRLLLLHALARRRALD
jgi:hypothetical protein